MLVLTNAHLSTYHRAEIILGAFHVLIHLLPTRLDFQRVMLTSSIFCSQDFLRLQSLTEGLQFLLPMLAIPQSVLRLEVYSANITYHQHTERGTGICSLLWMPSQHRNVITEVSLSNPTMHVNSLL